MLGFRMKGVDQEKKENEKHRTEEKEERRQDKSKANS